MKKEKELKEILLEEFNLQSKNDKEIPCICASSLDGTLIYSQSYLKNKHYVTIVD